MTEVPEHLLRRSRERKAAAAGGTDAGAPATDAAASSSAVEPAAAAAPAAGGGGRAPATPAAPAFTGPPAPPPRKNRVPIWAMPVLLALPFWALLYSGAFGERKASGEDDPVVQGQAVYAANCASCHGAGGGGGVGPALNTVLKTWPKFEDHIAWVENGSAPVKGQTYGGSGRVATGGMPSFKASLTPAEINAVVCHERVDYGKESPVPASCQAGATAEGGGSPTTTAGG